jgi:hypothetical protein
MTLPFSFQKSATLLAAIVGLASAGCAAINRTSCGCGECDGCPVARVACATYKGELADDVNCCSRCFGEGCSICDRLVPPVTCGPECTECRSCWLLPFGIGDKFREKPTPGPPPMTIRPPMPPKFLPVPTEDVMSPVRPDAPEPQRGNVDMGWRPQMTVSGHD